MGRGSWSTVSGRGGVRKEATALTVWLKEIAPSKALRQWFARAPKRWDEFRHRYHDELDRNMEAVRRLRDLSRTGRLTLFCSLRKIRSATISRMPSTSTGRLARGSGCSPIA
ncbi:DUF488 domain-containing protein [Methylocapsa aurea]|uniref:DUF488 domain-containing protein n=1 Tax=Methylocapsa aurea TaxID=663610 RepID=UPI00315B3805